LQSICPSAVVRAALQESTIMKLVRRQFLGLAGAAVVAPAISRLAVAQTYPTRPVRVLVGFAAGSAADITMRLMAE
jgi:tripartite-type tricarboxylate transporter receptor subunit TctC